MVDLGDEALRNLLRNLGQSEEEIKQNLEKIRQETKKVQKEKEEKEKALAPYLKTSEEAAEYLQQQLGGKWSHQKVRQLKREGLLQPYNNIDGNKVKKAGYRFHVDVLDEYVEVVKTPVSDLLKENLMLKEKVGALEKEVALQEIQMLKKELGVLKKELAIKENQVLKKEKEVLEKELVLQKTE